MGELGLVQPGQAVVEPIYSPTLPLEPEAKPASVEPAQHRGALGQQREVAHVVSVVAKPPDDLGEVAMVDQGHRDDDGALVVARDQIQDLVHAGPPGLQVLKVRTQTARKHAMQTEPEVLRGRRSRFLQTAAAAQRRSRFFPPPNGPLIHTSTTTTVPEQPSRPTLPDPALAAAGRRGRIRL